MENANRILLQCQEVLPLSMLENNNLRSKIDQMVYILRSISDDAIYNMKESNDKKTNTLLNLYANLSHFMQHVKPWLIGSLSLRMVEITMNSGLGSKASIAFAYFGGVLISIGYVSEGRRLGEICSGSLLFQLHTVSNNISQWAFESFAWP